MSHLPGLSQDHGSNSGLSSPLPSSERNKKPKRRAVACKGCHSLKVKCMPSDPNDTSSPCVRCLKSKKVCEIDTPQARKKKKPEERVAELELRLEQLTSQLNHRSSSPASYSTDASHNTSPRLVSHFNTSQPIAPAVQHSAATQRSSAVRNQQQSLPSTTSEYVSESESPEEHRKNRINKARIIEERFGPKMLHDISSAVTAANQARVDTLTIDPIDIIDSGYITLDEARARFQLYQNVVYGKYPFVSITDGFDTVRYEQRYLFMALMAVMGILRPTTEIPDIDSNLAILNLAQRHVMNEVIIIGNKSIELLKCMLLFSVWYNIPEMFHHRRYHIFSGLCISLCYDLALTGRPYFVVSKADGAFHRSLREHQKEEYRSLILTVYAESTGYTIFLRRKLAVTWSGYMEECCHLLRNSDEPRYRTISVIAKLTSLMEKIDLFLDPQDQENHPLIKHFASEIEQLKTVPTTLDSNVLKAFSASIEAFLYSKFSSKVLALKCLRATMDCIEGFSEMSAAEMNSVPLLIFGRLMYCFALFLRTCNILKYDFDLVFIDKLLDKLKICSENYRNNHIVLKIRLLLHFYLTTFAKNEDVFNGINDISSTETIAKTYAEQVSNKESYAPPDPQSFSTTVPHLNSILNGARRDSQAPSDLLRHSLSQQTPEATAMFPPANAHDSMAQLPVRPATTTPTALPGTYALPPHNGQHNVNMPSNDPFGLFNGNNTGNEQFDSGVPRLDMLSDATTKGFMDVPTDLLSTQDEFWKLFDYKQDDQFYL